MLLVVKLVMLLLVIAACSGMGMIIANKYVNRVKELQDAITALEIFETRIIYNYETIPECFSFISEHINSNIKRIFKRTGQLLKENNNVVTGDCLFNVIDEERIMLDLEKEDIEVLKGLSTSLGQTDLENQIKNIRLTIKNLNIQLEIAKLHKEKNYKLYRNIGAFTGMIVAIVLL